MYDWVPGKQNPVSIEEEIDAAKDVDDLECKGGVKPDMYGTGVGRARKSKHKKQMCEDERENKVWSYGIAGERSEKS